LNNQKGAVSQPPKISLQKVNQSGLPETDLKGIGMLYGTVDYYFWRIVGAKSKFCQQDSHPAEEPINTEDLVEKGIFV